MPANFDWQTEKESDWVDEPGDPQRPSTPIRQRIWFWPVVMVGLVALLGGLILFWQVRRRATAVTDSIEADITTSFELMTTAVEQGDFELFQSFHMQGGRHIGWGRMLDTLVSDDSQYWYGYRPGFTLLTDELQPDDIVMAPDLKSAQLVIAQPYAVHTATQVSQTITLQQIYTFALEEDGRWLLAAPDDDFWGDWLTYDSPRLNLSYPARDEALTLRIAAALDDNLAQLCEWSADLPTLTLCPDSLQFQVRWRKEIGSLTQLNQDLDNGTFHVNSSDNPIITMPSPTLVGTPTDAAGEQILVDLFVRQTMIAIFRNVFLRSDEVAWYRFADYNQALLNQLLVRMEVTAWPPPNLPPDDSAPPPIPWPEQAVALTCLEESGRQAAIYHLHPENGDWTSIFSDDDLVRTQLWPGGRILVQYLQGSDASWAVVEPDGTAVPVPLPEEPVNYLFGDGRYLFAPVTPSEEYAPATLYYALDWELCLQGDCQWQDLPGYIIWSPDKSQFLIQTWSDDMPSGQLLHGRSLEDPFEPIAKGTSPVWLDEETYSYQQVDLSDDIARSLVAAPIGGEPETLLASADLEAFMPPKTEDTDFWFYLSGVVPDFFLIHVHRYEPYSASFELPVSQHYLLLLDRSSGEMTIVAEDESLWGVTGEDGRTLVIIRYDSQDGILFVERYDVAKKETQILFEYARSMTNLSESFFRGPLLSWSEDGQWLLFFQDGLLILLAPDYNYKKVIAPETPGCFNAAWVKP
jgi:hypothetical protein